MGSSGSLAICTSSPLDQEITMLKRPRSATDINFVSFEENRYPISLLYRIHRDTFGRSRDMGEWLDDQYETRDILIGEFNSRPIGFALMEQRDQFAKIYLYAIRKQFWHKEIGCLFIQRLIQPESIDLLKPGDSMITHVELEKAAHELEAHRWLTENGFWVHKEVTSRQYAYMTFHYKIKY
jgi:hypothetical protein